MSSIIIGKIRFEPPGTKIVLPCIPGLRIAKAVRYGDIFAMKVVKATIIRSGRDKSRGLPT